MILMKNVYKNYDKRGILVNANFSVSKGDFLYIAGGSGCGKSTIIKLLTKQEEVTQGYIRIGKIDITSLKRHSEIQEYRRQIGIVFQDYQLIQEISAKDNLKAALSYLGCKSKDINIKIKKVSSELGITHLLDKKVSTLSGGEQQKVAIARAIINDPKVIFADEPTGNLDSKSGNEIMGIFQQLNEEGATIIMVTHEPEIAMHTKRMIVCRDGEIIEDKLVENQIIINKQEESL